MKNEEYSKQMIAKTKLLAVTLKLLRYKQQAVVGLSITYGKVVNGELVLIRLPLNGLFYGQ